MQEHARFSGTTRRSRAAFTAQSPLSHRGARTTDWRLSVHSHACRRQCKTRHSKLCDCTMRAKPSCAVALPRPSYEVVVMIWSGTGALAAGGSSLTFRARGLASPGTRRLLAASLVTPHNLAGSQNSLLWRLQVLLASSAILGQVTLKCARRLFCSIITTVVETQ
jgi:hypothetical protein